jgi:hypothetical protein
MMLNAGNGLIDHENAAAKKMKWKRFCALIQRIYKHKILISPPDRHVNNCRHKAALVSALLPG